MSPSRAAKNSTSYFSATAAENDKTSKEQTSIEMFLKHSSSSALYEHETVVSKGTDSTGGEWTRKWKRLRLSPSTSIDDETGKRSNANDTDNTGYLQEAKELQQALVELAQQKSNKSNVRTEIIKLTPDGSSWIVHIRNYKSPPTQEVFEQVWSKHPKTRKSIGKLFGRDKECHENRYSQSYGVSFSYSGYTDDVPRPIAEDDVLVELLQEVNSVVRTDRGPYNGCLMNWYVENCVWDRNVRHWYSLTLKRQCWILFIFCFRALVYFNHLGTYQNTP